MNIDYGYKHLSPRRGSLYRQYFVNGTRIRALVIYCATIPPESMTPEEVAEDYNLPLDVVHECIKYCQENADVLRLDWEDEEKSLAENRALYPKNYPVPPQP